MLIDTLSQVRTLMIQNPTPEPLILANGLATYGSATGASNDAGVFAFGWNMVEKLRAPEQRLALFHNDCRRPGFGFYDDRPVDEREADPAKGMMPKGVAVPSDWLWPKWIGADHQHDFWSVMWLTSAFVIEREAKQPTMPKWPGAPVGLRLEDLLLLRLSAHADAAAGVASMPYLLGDASWRGPDGQPKVNPDPSARGYAGPLLTALIANKAGAFVSPGDNNDFMRYLDVSLRAYENMPASYFDKAQTATPEVVRPYFIPAQEAQLVVAWESLAQLFDAAKVHPVYVLRLRSLVKRQCDMLTPWVGSCPDGATPWVVSMNDPKKRVPPIGDVLRGTHTPHRSAFNPSSWMAAAMEIACNYGIERADSALTIAQNSVVIAGPMSDTAFMERPIWTLL